MKSLKNIDKKTLIKQISISTGISFLASQKYFEDLILAIKSLLKNNNQVKIKNLGTFKLRKKNGRYGRNPKTNEEYYINPRKSVIFKVSDNIKKKINELTISE